MYVSQIPTYIRINPRERASLAMHIVSKPTRTTKPTRHERMQDDLVPDLEIRDRAADGVDPSCVLVPDGVGELHAGFGLPLAFEDVDVCSAYACL